MKSSKINLSHLRKVKSRISLTISLLIFFLRIILNTVKFTIFKFNDNKKFGPSQCLSFIKIPGIGSSNQNVAEKISLIITHFFTMVHVIFNTRSVLPSFHKDAKNFSCMSV